MSYLLSGIFWQLCEAFRAGNAARKKESSQDTVDGGRVIPPSEVLKQYFGDKMDELRTVKIDIDGRIREYLTTYVEGYTDGRNMVRISFIDEWPLISGDTFLLKMYYDNGDRDDLHFGDEIDNADILLCVCDEIMDAVDGPEDETEEDDE